MGPRCQIVHLGVVVAQSGASGPKRGAEKRQTGGRGEEIAEKAGSKKLKELTGGSKCESSVTRFMSACLM